MSHAHCADSLAVGVPILQQLRVVLLPPPCSAANPREQYVKRQFDDQKILVSILRNLIYEIDEQVRAATPDES